MLVKTRIDLMAKDLSKTALDIAMKRILLLSAGAKLASRVTDIPPSVAQRLRSSNPDKNKKSGNFYASYYKRYIRRTTY